MEMNGYVDEMMCEGLFDNIEDLLDFSTDDEVLGMGDDSSAPSAGGGAGGGGDGDDGAIQMPPAAVSAAAASFPSSDGEGCGVPATDDEAKICEEINIHEDWITNFLDDSNFDIDFPAATGIIAAAAPPSNGYIGGNGKVDDSLFQSFSPVSVLDEPNNLSSSNGNGGSSSSSSSSSTSSSRTNGTTADTVSLAMAPVGPTMMLVPARARSKRPRRAAPAPAHVAVPIVPPASEGPPAIPTLLPLPECESFGESEPCALPPMKKKKKNYQNFLAGNGRGDDTTAVRKCQHCGLQKTPQWRAGPMGPKTLCNACGVRYKSGRLFPEYRPAASPTFVPSIHSNSHKKVVEMRIKACQQKATNGMPSPEYPAAKNCDLLAYIRRRE